MQRQQAEGESPAIARGSSGAALIDATCQVLWEANGSLHYSEIAERLLRREWWATTSSDPARLLDNYVCGYLRANGDDAFIRRSEPGVYTLSERAPWPPHLPPLSEVIQSRSPVMILSSGRAADHVSAAIKVLSFKQGWLLKVRHIARSAVEMGLIPGPEHEVVPQMKRHLQREVELLDAWKAKQRHGSFLVLQSRGDKFGLSVWQSNHVFTNWRPRPQQAIDVGVETKRRQAKPLLDAAETVLDKHGRRFPMLVSEISHHILKSGLLREEQIGDRTKFKSVLLTALLDDAQMEYHPQRRFELRAPNYFGLIRWKEPDISDS